jgi:hypothetical protein
MSHKIKILSLGFSQSNFLIQLYSEILKIDNRFLFDVDGFFELSDNKIEQNNHVFNEMHDYSKTKVSYRDLFKHTFFCCFNFDFWSVFIFEFFILKNSFKNKIKSIYSYIRQRAIVHKAINKYDIFHFHYCIPEHLGYIRFLPKESKIICSFWGSDLLRSTGLKHQFYVKRALERADYITTQSQELKDVIISKFGKELSSKINLTRFTISTSIFDHINNILAKEGKNEFLAEFNIKTKKKIITIAYNAKEENNHIPIIKSLDRLTLEDKKKIYLILPLAYGLKSEYEKKLTNALEGVTNLEYSFISGFLDPYKVAKLRAFTDIQIQMPTTDALSASVMEVMYAGNFVITGNWLPYSPYEDSELIFYKAANYNELNVTLIKILNNFNSLKKKHIVNKKRIEKFFFPVFTSKTWLKVYEKCINN